MLLQQLSGSAGLGYYTGSVFDLAGKVSSMWIQWLSLFYSFNDYLRKYINVFFFNIFSNS